MDVFLPIAQVFVNPIEILFLSAIVGVLSGLFGVGGGFLMTPFLIFLGVPPAYAGGTPKKIKNGVIKNPPPTPNNPDNTPTIALKKRISIGLTNTCAIGKNTSIKNLKVI